MKNVVSYDIKEMTSTKFHRESDIIYELERVARELADNQKYLSLDNADDLINFTIHNADIDLRYFPAIDCDGNNIIIFYLYDELEHADYFLKAMTKSKYEDNNRFSTGNYGMRIYYRIDNLDCVFSIMDDGTIETEVSYAGEVYQGCLSPDALDFLYELDSDVIKDIKAVEQQVEVRCKLAGML